MAECRHNVADHVTALHQRLRLDGYGPDWPAAVMVVKGVDDVQLVAVMCLPISPDRLHSRWSRTDPGYRGLLLTRDPNQQRPFWPSLYWSRSTIASILHSLDLCSPTVRCVICVLAIWLTEGSGRVSIYTYVMRARKSSVWAQTYILPSIVK